MRLLTHSTSDTSIMNFSSLVQQTKLESLTVALDRPISPCSFHVGHCDRTASVSHKFALKHRADMVERTADHVTSNTQLSLNGCYFTLSGAPEVPEEIPVHNVSRGIYQTRGTYETRGMYYTRVGVLTRDADGVLRALVLNRAPLQALRICLPLQRPAVASPVIKWSAVEYRYSIDVFKTLGHSKGGP